jgi:hypothetical protein
MQTGGFPRRPPRRKQWAGFLDPGSAAFIGTSVLAAGTAYGASLETEESKASALELEKRSLSKELAESKKDRDADSTALELAKAETEALSREVRDRDAKLAAVTESSRANSLAVAAFQKASLATRTQANATFVKNLATDPDYGYLVATAKDAESIEKALGYGATINPLYARITLPQLFVTHVAPVLAGIQTKSQTGAARRRRRRQRGGDPPTLATPPPTDTPTATPTAPGPRMSMTYEVFATKYAEALAGQTASAFEKERAASDDRRKAIVIKASRTLASTLRGVVGPIESKKASSDTIVSALRPETRVTLIETETALTTTLANVHASVQQLETSPPTTPEDWDVVRRDATERREALLKAAAAYTAAVDQAKKDDLSALTDLGRRPLFNLPPLSIGNPFAAVVGAIAASTTAAEAAKATAATRAKTSEMVAFVRTVYDSVPAVLSELKSYQLRAAKGGRRRRRRRGGAPVGKGILANEEVCASLMETDKYKEGDPAFLEQGITMVSYGSAEGTPDPTSAIRWVDRAPTDDSERPSLKYLLGRLNTGAFASTTDYLSQLMGKDITYTVDDLANAGEAYVLLRCYLTRAADIVKGIRGKETVLGNLTSSTVRPDTKAGPRNPSKVIGNKFGSLFPRLPTQRSRSPFTPGPTVPESSPDEFSGTNPMVGTPKDKSFAELTEMLDALDNRETQLNAIVYGPEGRSAYNPRNTTQTDAKNRLVDLRKQIADIKLERSTRPEYTKAQAKIEQDRLAAVPKNLATVTSEIDQLQQELQTLDPDTHSGDRPKAAELVQSIQYKTNEKALLERQLRVPPPTAAPPDTTTPPFTSGPAVPESSPDDEFSGTNPMFDAEPEADDIAGQMTSRTAAAKQATQDKIKSGELVRTKSRRGMVASPFGRGDGITLGGGSRRRRRRSRKSTYKTRRGSR